MTNTRLIHSHSLQLRREPKGILQDEGNTSLAFVSAAGPGTEVRMVLAHMWFLYGERLICQASLSEHYVFIRKLSQSQTALSRTTWRIVHLVRGFVEGSLSHSSDIYHQDSTQLSNKYTNCENPVVGLYIIILRNFWQTKRKRNLTRDLRRLTRELRVVWWVVFGGVIEGMHDVMSIIRWEKSETDFMKQSCVMRHVSVHVAEHDANQVIGPLHKNTHIHTLLQKRNALWWRKMVFMRQSGIVSAQVELLYWIQFKADFIKLAHPKMKSLKF